MSCNGCRVLRKGCSDSCVLRQCLKWIDNPDAQGHATVFVAKFFGRAGMMALITSVADAQRPALFQSLLYEACGRTINPVFGAVGLLCSGNWKLCQEAVDTVLKGGLLCPSSTGTGRPGGFNLLMHHQQQQQQQHQLQTPGGGGGGGKLPKFRLGRGYVNLATFQGSYNNNNNTNTNNNTNLKMKQEVVEAEEEEAPREEEEGMRRVRNRKRRNVRHEQRYIGTRNNVRDDDGVEEDKGVLEGGGGGGGGGGGPAPCSDEGPGLDLSLSCFDESTLVKRKGQQQQEEAPPVHVYHHHHHHHHRQLGGGGGELARAATTTSTSSKKLRRCSSPSCHSSEADSDTTTDLSISLPLCHSATTTTTTTLLHPPRRELLLDLLH